jgi:hypothetical protein
MKKIIVMLMVCVFMLVGCGEDKRIGKVEYKTQGVFTEKNPNIHYEISIGNVVWSILLFETVVFPVYFIGWSIYNPVCKNEDYVPGVGCKDNSL